MPARSAVAFPTVAELLFGAAKAGWGVERLRRLEAALGGVTVLLPDMALVRTCASLRAEAVRLGHPLGDRANANDLWIGACAVHRLPLVTGNARHFDGLPGLELVIPGSVDRWTGGPVDRA